MDSLDNSYIILLDARIYIDHHDYILANIGNEHVHCLKY